MLERVWPLLAPAPARPLLFLDTVIGLDAILALQLPVAMLKVRSIMIVCQQPASLFSFPPASAPMDY